jgi:hypothetical protein
LPKVINQIKATILDFPCPVSQRKSDSEFLTEKASRNGAGRTGRGNCLSYQNKDNTKAKNPN